MFRCRSEGSGSSILESKRPEEEVKVVERERSEEVEEVEQVEEEEDEVVFLVSDEWLKE